MENRIIDFTGKDGEFTIKPQTECSLFIGNNIENKPELSLGQYWLFISGSAYYIRVFKKPNVVKRLFLSKLFGLEFYEAKE